MTIIEAAGVVESVLPKHLAGITIEHQPQKLNYETVLSYLESEICEPDFRDPKDRQIAIETDEIWIMQWFPDTPIGSYSIASYSLAGLLAFAKEFKESK